MTDIKRPLWLTLSLRFYAVLNLLIAFGSPIQIVGFYFLSKSPTMSGFLPFGLLPQAAIVLLIGLLSLMAGVAYWKRSPVLSLYAGTTLCIIALTFNSIWAICFHFPFRPTLVLILKAEFLLAGLFGYGLQLILLLTKFRRDLRDT